MKGMSVTTMTSTMAGAVLPGNSTAVVKEYPIPQPGHGQLLVRIGASGICGSDLSYIYREHKTHVGQDGPAYKGVIAGHEPSGQIVEAGPGCKRFAVGDRVIVYHIVGCGFCIDCRSGNYISCTRADVREAYGWQRDGGHAEYILVEESTCVPLPDELTYVDGALIACGFGTAYEGLLRTAVSGNDEFCVVGLGPVGLAAGMLAKAMGAKKVVGIELAVHRREFAASLGIFDHVIEAGSAAGDEVRAVTAGRGCSVTMDCSGSAPGRTAAIDAVAVWGRLSLVGEGGQLQTEVSDNLLHKQLTIFASWVTSVQSMERLATNIVEWGISPRSIVSNVFPLSEADAAYNLAASGQVGKVVLESAWT